MEHYLDRHYLDNFRLSMLAEVSLKHGLCEQWHENGQLFEKSNWKDGDRHGLWEWWYDNGQLKKRITIKQKTK